ncbi:hypothetical protein BU23DRAFT_602436 [Bimuria novae-zelandiae CBS 107.79]|uniref:DUF4419 domain-containing protein n=1 Tax=Bimuria novae-zelandiae CBS 107.79 TaxID=1447943 RepID=A0A6A5UT27_9PLEO|nr:hypothetical protein BU23DRAFT_602436 [Bimuria novae-zelandiae CBS 107.79]
MPVTVYPSSNPAAPWEIRKANTDKDLLPQSEQRKNKEIIRSSILSADYAEKHITSSSNVEFAVLAKFLEDMIQANVKTPDLQAWIMPSFSTTTECDRAVASILIMGAMQEYFGLRMTMVCGLPSVTLLGERNDWENILQRLDMLHKFGDEPAAFAQLLRPVIRSLIESFDSEPTASVLEFWGRIAHHESGGSGPSYLSGWIAAFCFWDKKGWLMNRRAWYEKVLGKDHKQALEGESVPEYGKVDIEDILNGYASVPVKINDNRKEYFTQVIAGSIGIQAFNQMDFRESLSGEASSTIKNKSETTIPNGDVTTGTQGAATAAPSYESADTELILDSCRPLTGWILYHTNTPEDGHMENDEQERWII